jgi:thioredoxin-related protein
MKPHDDDARFVIEKMSLNYPTLKAEGLPAKYSVQGFPTLVVIDQQGVVRKRHVGYSPTLKAELSKTIDELLKTSK